MRRIDFGADGKAAAPLGRVFSKVCPEAAVMIVSRDPMAGAQVGGTVLLLSFFRPFFSFLPFSLFLSLSLSLSL